MSSNTQEQKKDLPDQKKEDLQEVQNLMNDYLNMNNRLNVVINKLFANSNNYKYIKNFNSEKNFIYHKMEVLSDKLCN